jgi:two-component system, OmpR family, phosphate regulon response regulator OmpR
MDKPLLLLVDDDAGIRELLGQYLGAQGFEVMLAADAGEMDQALAQCRPDLIILDLMLPGEDGLSIARRLKAGAAIPIIMLSARGEDVDRIVGLEVGADDYLPKPFNPRELLARIRAVLRRSVAGSASTEEANVAGFGPYRLDLDAQTLSRESEEIPLTAAEFELLKVFVTRPNRVLSRDQLVDLLRGYERDPFDRSIDVRVTRLRRKIEPDPASPVYIRTVWGQGYLFSPKGKAGN